jgi:hypothetical protein
MTVKRQTISAEHEQDTNISDNPSFGSIRKACLSRRSFLVMRVAPSFFVEP